MEGPNTDSRNTESSGGDPTTVTIDPGTKQDTTVKIESGYPEEEKRPKATFYVTPGEDPNASSGSSGTGGKDDQVHTVTIDSPPPAPKDPI